MLTGILLYLVDEEPAGGFPAVVVTLRNGMEAGLLSDVVGTALDIVLPVRFRHLQEEILRLDLLEPALDLFQRVLF